MTSIRIRLRSTEDSHIIFSKRISSIMLSAVVIIAVGIFLLPTELVSAHYLPLSCPGAITSLNGATPTDFSVQDPFIEIEFKLNFGCDRLPEFIDQGVRLEVRLQSATSQTSTAWLPIKYYTPSLLVPSQYDSLVQLDSSMTSVTAHEDLGNITLPLMVVSSSMVELVLIREYICGQLVHNLTEDMQLELRWLQSYGRSTQSTLEATWILDDIKIRIWNAMSFLQVMSEDFGASDQMIHASYDVISADIQQNLCGLPTEAGRFLYFNGIVTGGITRRSITAVNEPKGIFVSSEKSCEYLVSELFRDGVSEMVLQDLLNKYGAPLPKAISDIVIDSATDALKNISGGVDSDAGGHFLEFLDSFGLLGYNSSLGKVSNDFLTFQVTDVSRDDYMNPDERLVVLHEPEGTISLPGELFSAFFSEVMTDIRVVTFVFKNLSGILPEETDDGPTNTMLGSPVLSATLGCMAKPCRSRDIVLNTSILLEIHHFDNFRDNEIPGIHFFDLEKNVWSSRGCKCNRILSNSSFSFCQCNHLSHFAILRSSGLLIITKVNEGLAIVGYIGTAFSMLGLIIIWITMLMFKKVRDHDTSKFHIQLSLAIFFMLIIFMAGVDMTAVTEWCIVVSLLTRYFTLAAILWMLAESLLLFQKVVFVFKPVTKKMIIITSLFCWLTPIVPVALPLIIYLKNGSKALIISDNLCLPSNPLVVWLGLTVPISIIVLVNSVVFIIIIVVLVRRNRRRLSRETKSLVPKKVTRIMVSLTGIMFLLGIPWVIGPIVNVRNLSIPVGHVFNLFVSFQGFFIFVFFCINSKDARESWGKLLSGTYKSCFPNRRSKTTKGMCNKRQAAGSAPAMNYTPKKPLSTSNKKSLCNTPVELEDASAGKKKQSNIYPEPGKHKNLSSGTAYEGEADVGDIAIR